MSTRPPAPQLIATGRSCVAAARPHRRRIAAPVPSSISYARHSCFGSDSSSARHIANFAVSDKQAHTAALRHRPLHPFGNVALRNPTINELSQTGWVAVETVIDEHVAREIIPSLKAAGAEGIIEYPLNKVVY